jgi:hypothetical protein
MESAQQQEWQPNWRRARPTSRIFVHRARQLLRAERNPRSSKEANSPSRSAVGRQKRTGGFPTGGSAGLRRRRLLGGGTERGTLHHSFFRPMVPLLEQAQVGAEAATSATSPQPPDASSAPAGSPSPAPRSAGRRLPPASRSWRCPCGGCRPASARRSCRTRRRSASAA